MCSECGEVVDYRDIAKAYESDDGRMVVITDDDIASLPEERSREIEVLEFVPQLTSTHSCTTAAITSSRTVSRRKSYVLLAKTLAETDRVAIVHFALRNKTRLAALQVKEFAGGDERAW